MTRTSLPPGFRFHPTDVELIMYYLKKKVMGKKLIFEVISELNIYKFSPWDLPDKSCLKSKDLEWYFFCPREKKYASGARMNRATQTGYWKTTGKDRPVHYDKNRVGMVKTLVFHQGNAPRGQRTDWVIHEYRIEDKTLADMGVAQEAYVLCKVFHKNGPGPKNGAQYGAPFKEEDWDDDNEEIPVDSLLPDAPALGPSSILPLPENENSSDAMSAVDLGNATGLSLNEPGPSSDKVILDGQNNSIVTSVVDPGKAPEWFLSDAGLSSANHSGHDMNLDTEDDDIFHLLAAFSEDTLLLPAEYGNNEKLGDRDQGKASETVPRSDGSDLFSGLGDLSNLAELNGGGLNFLDTCDAGCTVNVLPEDDILELNDLDAPLNFSAGSFGNEPSQIGGFHRPCSFSGSEQLLAGRSCTPYNTTTGLGQLWFGGNFPGYNPYPTTLHQSLTFPDSSERPGNPDSSFQAGNDCNSINAAHSLDFTYRQEEEIRNAAGNQERGDFIISRCPLQHMREVSNTSYLWSVGAAGVQQSIVFSRLQQLLESVPADPASAAYDGSSIHVKAEVTYRFSTCTKDALSVVLGESTFVYGCWWNLPGLEFWKTVEYCSTGSAAVFCLRFGSVFICIVNILLLMELGCYLWNWLFVNGLIGFFKKVCDFVLINLLVSNASACLLKLQVWNCLLWEVWHLRYIGPLQV